MFSCRSGSLVFVPLAIAGAATLGVAPTTAPAPATGTKTVLAQVQLADTEAWGMGGSGDPIPSAETIAAVSERYNPASPLFDGQPLFPVDTSQALFTPEGWYPVIAVKNLPFDTSVAQGLSILDSTITSRIAAGHDLVIAGGSQSATIETLEMRNLLALPAAEQPTADQLSFVLLGDPNNPNGGLLERFGDPSLPPLSAPSVGLTFSGATPAETPWDTAIYTLEYDGFADFPRYPLNFLADLNAFAGILFVHPTYTDIPVERLSSAIELPVSDDYTGHTQYFMIPTETLPLLQPLQSIPVIGQPLYDLLEPDMRILVNLGYGSITEGWDHGPANVPTPFGLFPDVDLGDVLTALGKGAVQGVQDFVDDLGSLSFPDMSDAAGAGVAASSLPSLTDIVNTFSSAFASAYATLLPAADIVNFLTTTVPAYDASLFVQELMAGDLLDAVGLPIAASEALGSLAIGFELAVVAKAATSIIDDFQDLFAS